MRDQEGQIRVLEAERDAFRQRAEEAENRGRQWNSDRINKELSIGERESRIVQLENKVKELQEILQEEQSRV
jgi:uncharacterized protein YqgV (UPF0045/DUF77 family)